MRGIALAALLAFALALMISGCAGNCPHCDGTGSLPPDSAGVVGD